MQKRNGREIVTQLIRAYEEEAKLYAGLEDAAVEQHELLRNGHDPRRLAALTERQQQFAEQIGKIEAGIAPLREYWEQIRDADPKMREHRLARTLDALLERLADCIHTIVEVDKENSRALMAEMTPIRIGK